MILIDSSEPRIATALYELLTALGLQDDAAASAFHIEGGDYPHLGPYRLATAGTAVAAAYAAAVAALWRERGGASQSIRVTTAHALQSLRSFLYLRQNGQPVPATIHDAISGFHRTADGRWIYVYGHDFAGDVLDVLQITANEAGLTRAIGAWRAQELEDALASRKVPAAIVRSESEWRDHPQGRWLAARPVVEIDCIGASRPEPPTPLEPLAAPAMRPLSGLRVLDLSHVICGPMIGRHLAEHGADVLQVVAPHHPDPAIVTLDTGWGKRIAEADFRRPADAARIKDLAASADVIIQSWRPGALDRHGFGAEALAANRPGLVYVSASCFGSGGPWGNRGGYDPVAQAATGIALAEMHDGKPRQVRTLTLNDYLAAYLGAAGTVSALLRRSRQGGSYHVKVALAGTSMWTQSLGQIPVTAEQAGMEFADPVPPRLLTMQSAFGSLTTLIPAADLSASPARLDGPPAPAGTAELAWI
jgi:crotonobetainyl-CoA:carnitine CoA-transferase CaiB-like acyl-CoA transferase